MKFLINQEFVAIRKGAFVSADLKAGEFIFDASDANFAKATLNEIALANKIKISSKLSGEEAIQILREGLEKMNIPEQNTQTESQKVKDIVESGHKSGKSEDAIIIELVQSGISFKKVGKLYKQVVEELGLAVNTKDIKTRGGEIMAADEFKPKSFEEFEGMVKKIAAEFPKADISQIHSVVRRYLRANKIEIPKAPEGQRGATGFRKVAFEWMLSNSSATAEQLTDFIVKEKEKDAKVAARYVEFFEFAKKFASAQVVKSDDEVVIPKKKAKVTE